MKDNLLNPEQQEAVNTIEGPLLVLAGAGSGKTRVVTFRIANLIEIGVPSSQILGLTFTNKAAAEMKERVHQLTHRHVLICTFHSLGARILRESIDRLGYGRDFLIYDESDTEKLLKTCLEELQINKKVDLKNFRSFISHAKNSLQEPEDRDASGGKDETFCDVYALYQTKLREYNALDFDDLLFLTVKLFKEHPDVLEHYQDRWSFLLIDEYQDTNAVQYQLVRFLVAKQPNLCVVGDPDQSIYSWRGADVHNILNFAKDFPGSKIIKLEQNYRSHTNILNGANALISHNSNRFEKELWSNLGQGEKIKYFAADNEQGEADFVSERVKYHHEEHGIPLREMAVFYRTNFQSRSFEDTFLSKRLPFVIVGGISFYQRKEIKDILAFLRMIQSGSDYISFERTINLPKRGLGEATLEKIRQAASKEGRTIFGYCEALIDKTTTSTKLSAKQYDGLKEYVEMIRDLKVLSAACSLTELVRAAIERTRYGDILQSDRETFEDRNENVKELVSKAAEWEVQAEKPSLSGFLEELSLKSSLDEAEGIHDRVNLMTVHNGKGLEFRVVFVVGLEDNLFPHANSLNSVEAFEEERRLCYVGMTRAKEFLYLSRAKYRCVWGVGRIQKQSAFLEEIPQEYIEKIGHRLLTMPRTKPPSLYSPKPQEPDVDEFAEPVIFYEGDTVVHPDFGSGVISQIYDGSMGLTLKVLFSKDRRERAIVAKYAHLRKL